MKFQKLFLTSALCMCAIMPAFADIASDAESATCENSVIGATSGTTALEADWTAITYHCGVGTYFNKANQTCTTCPAGSYCSDDNDYTMDSEEVGLYSCRDDNSEDFPLSEAGATSGGLCYRTGTVDCAQLNKYLGGHGTAQYGANSTAVPYRAYSDYGDPDDLEDDYPNGYFLDNPRACAYTLNCDAGYTATTPGVLASYVHQNVSWDGNTNIKYRALNGDNGSNSGNNNQGSHAGMSNGEYSVAWPDGTIVKGHAMCSSTNGSYAQTGTPDTSGTGDTKYCWCNMDSYSVAGGATQNVASPSWVFDDAAYGSASGCADNCAIGCANRVQGASDFRSALFGSLGANPVCQANNITIEWYNQDSKILENQCTYDGTVTLPATPSRAGYIFGGWKVRE